jgi:predicted DNA binding CopG/RHH family protein
MYYNEVEMLERDGKMGAVRTKPLRGSARPPPFPQSACGYSEKWLRILLRATPRDPTEQEKTMARTKQNEVATRRIFIRITDAEKAVIKDQAKGAGLTMSEYMRRIAFNKRIVSKMDQKALGELARLGGLQKHLLKQIKGLPYEEVLRKELNLTLSAVLNAVSRLNAAVGK